VTAEKNLHLFSRGVGFKQAQAVFFPQGRGFARNGGVLRGQRRAGGRPAGPVVVEHESRFEVVGGV